MADEDRERTTPKQFLKGMLPITVAWLSWTALRLAFPDTSPWLLMGCVLAAWAALALIVVLVRRKRRDTPHD